MSLDSLGPKMTIMKAADYAKETNLQQKKGEVALAQLTSKAKADEDLRQHHVRDVHKPDAAAIQREKERRKRQGASPKAAAKKDGAAAAPLPEVGGASSKIDIRI